MRKPAHEQDSKCNQDCYLIKGLTSYILKHWVKPIEIGVFLHLIVVMDLFVSSGLVRAFT